MENYKNKIVTRYPSGQIDTIKYTLGTTLHRTNGPALIHRHSNKSGRIIREVYYIYNKIHRDDGPAVIRYFSDLSFDEDYYLNDQSININDFIDCIRRSENKTETFVKFLGSIKEQGRRKALFTIAPNMFMGEIEEQVLRNIEIFL